MTRGALQHPARGMLLAVALLARAGPAHAYCPSYTPAQTATGARCAIEPTPGRNPDLAMWRALFGSVARAPDAGTFGEGCGRPRPRVEVPARFPCIVLQVLAMQETGWRQFCVPDTPAGSVGAPERTIVTNDCGYGVGQITSGMRVGETPAFDRARVASDPAYNLATGTRFLRDKWRATACVGDQLPDVVEHWYSALWAYNGLSYANNPNNPNLKAGRGPWDPRNGGAYAYQERVFGWMEHPPSDSHWKAVAPAYPNRGEIGDARQPRALSEPSCASPTDCTASRPTHLSRGCDDVVATGADAGVDAPADPAVPAAPSPIDASTDAPSWPTISVEGRAEAGCSCRTAPAAGQAGSAATLLALAGALLRRRRTGERPRRPGARRRSA